MAAGHKQHWSDLSQRERTLVVVAGTIQVSLTVAALADLRRRPARRINGDKRAWVAASFVNFVGPIAYFAFGRK